MLIVWENYRLSPHSINTVPDWITDNLNLISTLTNVIMLLVWVFYARLLYKDFSRQRSPVMFIHRTFGESLNPDCLVVNLSSDTVHILCVLMTLRTRHGVFTSRITEYNRMAPDEHGQRQLASHDQMMESYKQGPLPPGYFLSLNNFRTMIQTVKVDSVDGHFGDDDRTPTVEELVESIKEVELRIVAIYGLYVSPVGARRTFRINRTALGLEVLPTMELTRQYCSYWGRRTARRWLRECR